MAKKVKEVNTDQEDLQKAIKLLKDSVGFINYIPNRKIIHNQGYNMSYDLASAIDKFLNKYK